MTASSSSDKKLLPEDVNKRLVKIFKELADIEKNRGEVYKAKAYRIAVQSIEASPHPITSGAKAMELKGVGKKIAKKIDEIIESGSLLKLEKELQDETVLAYRDLERVSGIGPAFAKKLVTENEIKSIAELRAAVAAKTIKLNNQQLIGLNYLEELEEKVPRDEIKLFESIILSAMDEVDPDMIMTVCGSYRRGLPASSDIDILVTQLKTSSECAEEYTLLEKVVKKLSNTIITDTIASGKSKFAGVCILPDNVQQFKPHKHRRIDLRFIPYDQYWCGILYFTGSDMFNTQMRIEANKKKLHLNEYRICKLDEGGNPDEKALVVHSEKDIFDYIGMDFKKPEERSTA